MFTCVKKKKQLSTLLMINSWQFELSYYSDNSEYTYISLGLIKYFNDSLKMITININSGVTV